MIDNIDNYTFRDKIKKGFNEYREPIAAVGGISGMLIGCGAVRHYALEAGNTSVAELAGVLMLPPLILTCFGAAFVLSSYFSR